MKRFLSLVLSLVMVMSLVTVSAGAKDFADDDAITYGEAVAVVSEVGIVDGYADGEFKPTNTLTRQAAAKIICNLILGPTTAAELHADTAPYPDVPTSSEFAGYIAYCQSRKIISGYGDGNFRPGNTLTGYAFMKMLLGALGYDATLEGYTGANWSINVAKQALHIGLDDNLETKEGAVFNGLKAVTREEACLYAFNTLQADLVEYNQRVTTNVNGTEITLSSGGAESRKWTSQQSRNDNILRDDIIQFAEEYFNKLVRRDDYTMFMEPANLWLYDKVEIGTFERLDLLTETYTTEVTGRDMYDLLKAGVIADNDLEVYIDGVDALGSGTVTFGGDTYGKFDKGDLVRSNTTALGKSSSANSFTGDGVLTKVYVDTDRDLITVASRHTWLAKATADYSESREYAPLSMYITPTNSTRTYNVDVEDVPAVADVTKDTFYQVNVSWKNTGVAGTGEVVIIKDVEILEDSTVTKFSAGANGSGAGQVTKLTTGGTEYKANVKAFYDKDVLDTYNETLLTNNTYNVFLDSNGYFIGVELFEGTKNYVFVTGFDRNSSNLSVKTATACGIFLDGTMKNFQVNVTDTDKNIGKATGGNAAEFIKWSTPGYELSTSAWGKAGKYGRDGIYDLNQWYTYIEDDNGTYTLKPCTRMTATRYLPPVGKEVAPWGTDSISDTIRTDALSVVDSLTSKERVYGEDETIFLTVDLDIVDTTDGTQKAITEVTGVYTGVQNVDIDVDVADTLAIKERQVFTVYDSDYYVIGAVVIGEARGATANYAYITSYAKSEELRDGTYYWEFDAVVGGEHQTLTARSKFHSTIEALNPDTVQELRFDGDYVVAIKDVGVTKFYTNYTQEIKDTEEIYAMRDELTSSVDDDPTELTLQGHTLYVTNARRDVGLALASDAKAVTIQKENGSNKKTNFADVASAIDHLADEDPAAPGVQYDGKIYAVLNSNKTAQWVVFVNDVELITGTGSQTGGGKDDGKYYKATSYIYENGFATLSVDVTRPAWLDDGAALDYTYDIYVNDAPYGSVNTATSVDVPVNGLTATTNWDNSTGNMFLYRPIKAGDVITVKNFKFTLANHVYFVEYVDQNGAVLFRDSNVAADKIDTKDLTAATSTVTSTAGGTTVAFNISNTKYVNGDTAAYTISNLTGADTTGTATVGTATSDASQQAKANLEDYVRVTIDLRTVTANTDVGVIGFAATNLNTVTGAPAEAAGLTLAVAGNRRTPAGGTVKVTYTAAGTIAATNGYGIKATLSDGTEIIWKNDGAVPTAVNKNVVLTKDETITIVSVEKLEAPKVVSVSLNDADASGTLTIGDIITVTFDKDVKAATYTITPTGAVKAAGNVVVAAGSLNVGTITLTAAPTAATDSITFTGLEDDETGVKTASAGVWTIVTSDASGMTPTSLRATYA